MVVVVSAMGKSTSELVALAREAANAAGTEELPRRELDMLVSTGERVTMALLAIMLSSLGSKARSFTGSQSGIITTETHFDSRIVEVRPHRIADALQRGEIVVVAGYQGMSQKREITTLGRGGSDTTAVALAAALGARACEIYSDVDGVYTSDPRKIESATHLGTVGYDFVWNLARAGARVLNQEAVRLAKESGTTILARSTFATGNPPRETRVTWDADVAPCRAVVELGGVLEVHGALSTWHEFRAYAEATGVGLAQYRCDALSWKAWLPCDADALAKLERFRAGSLAIDGGLSVVSMVSSDPDAASAALPLFGAAARAAYLAPGRVSVLVPEASAAALAAELHELWVSGGAMTASVA
jgi:aspartate kinase